MFCKFPTIINATTFSFLMMCCTATFAQDWFEYNRTLSVSTGIVQQHYLEADPFALTANGILNQEQGTLNTLELVARWQAESHPLLLQSTVRRTNGGTRYNGYLQAGNVLTPFNATTGNIMLDTTLRAGLPILHNENLQWIPFIELQRHQWERRLTQYTEHFDHTAALLGIQMQWRHLERPWSGSLEGAAGQTIAANMNAPAFSFHQNLGHRGMWQLGATLAYNLTPTWRIHSRLTTQHFAYGQSAIQGGVLIPSNRTQQNTLDVGLDWQY